MPKLLLVFLCLMTATSHAQNVSWDSKDRQPFRGRQVKAPGLFLMPFENGEVSDSVGVALGEHITPESFEAAIDRVLSEKEASVFDKAQLVVTGVGMNREK
jgi:hypothetical protein